MAGKSSGKKKPVRKDMSPPAEKKSVANKNISLILPLFGILILAFLVYLRSLNNGFTNYDDDVLITDNLIVQHLSYENIHSIFFSFINGMYHPLVSLSWALEYSFFGAGAFHFHLINLLFHLLNIWLVYRFILLLSKKKDIAFIVAIVFAVHPLVSESVLWLSERKDLLCTAFIFGGLVHYLKYLKNNLRRKYLILTFVFFLLALLSKPSAVVFPFLLMVIDYYLNRKFDKRALFEKVPFFILSAFFGIIALLASGSVESIDLLADYSVSDRIFMISYAIMFYVFKLIVPIDLTAKHFYPELNNGFLEPVYYVSFVFILMIIIVLVKYYRHKREIISGIFFYLASISVVLPILSVGDTIVAERYSYLSYIGLLLIISHLYNEFKDFEIRKVKLKSVMYVVFTAEVFMLSYLTYSKTAVWKNSESLWTNVIKEDHYATLAYVARGDARAAAGEYSGAENDYSLAIVTDSTSSIAYNNRGYIRIRLRDYVNAELDLSKAIEIQPGFSQAYYNRSCMYIETGEYLKAIDDCNSSIRLTPDLTLAYYNRGNAYYNLEEYEKAIADFDQAISMDNTEPLYYYCRAKVYYDMGIYAMALTDFSKVVEMNPDNADALFYRSKCYTRFKRYAESIADLNTLLYTYPDDSRYLYYRGNNKLMNADYEGALKDFNAVIASNASYAPGYYGRAQVSIASGVLNDVCSDLRKAMELGLEIDKEMLEQYCNK